MERYIEFINKFAPVECWEEIVSHPLQDIADYVEELNPSQDMSDVTRKRWFEKYPTDLSPEEIARIISDSYAHRSGFIHRGEQPPHREPVSFNRFFQESRHYDGHNLTETLLPNYDLLAGIARRAITQWAHTRPNCASFNDTL